MAHNIKIVIYYLNDWDDYVRLGHDDLYIGIIPAGINDVISNKKKMNLEYDEQHTNCVMAWSKS